MYTEYKNLSGNSRVWIYQSNRPFEEKEIELISEKTINFLNQWQHHRKDLISSFTIKYNQFLILAVDENCEVSGCSVDTSIRFIKELEAEFNVIMTDRLNISFKNGENINVVKMSDFQSYAKQGKITSETIVFNNMIDTKDSLETKWEVPAKESWHKRFLA